VPVVFRTLFIWIVSLGLGWETFKYLQVLGFIVLIYGTFLFNNVVKAPNWIWLKDGTKDENAMPSDTLVVPGTDEERPLLGAPSTNGSAPTPRTGER
jgi:hypothetical protein